MIVDDPRHFLANRIPGPVCTVASWFEPIDSGTLSLSAVAVAGPVVNPISDSDKAEFKLIQKMACRNSRNEPYTSAANYVEDRNRFFGSAADYAAFSIESDNELTNTTWGKPGHTRKLGDLLEFNKDPQKQLIFYRWVRKAYQNRYGDDVDVPQLIRKGMSEELAEKLKAVRASVRVKNIHDENFHAGGFNPRPEKLAGGYRLGTLSEHATGLAIDIDDEQNAQFTADEWKFIQQVAGKTIGRKGRWDTEEHATALWTDIQEINDLFVAKVAAQVTAIETKRAAELAAAKALAAKKEAAGGKPDAASKPDAAAKPAAAEKPKAANMKPPLQEVLGTHYDRLKGWTGSGFFHLPLELVLEFQAQGFTWGATFSGNVDLHHFELDHPAAPHSATGDWNTPGVDGSGATPSAAGRLPA